MKIRRMGSLLLVCCLLAGLLSGCGKDTAPEGEVIEKPTILTHVYRGEDLELADAYDIQEYLGIRDGNFVFLGSYFRETPGETPEEYTYESYPVLCTLPLDGGEPAVERIEGHEWVNRMVLTDGGYMILNNRWDEAAMQSVFELEITMDDGTVKKVENLASFSVRQIRNTSIWIRSARMGKGIPTFSEIRRLPY